MNPIRQKHTRRFSAGRVQRLPQAEEQAQNDIYVAFSALDETRYKRCELPLADIPHPTIYGWKLSSGKESGTRINAGDNGVQRPTVSITEDSETMATSGSTKPLYGTRSNLRLC
jgi:hypothetical protein